MANPVIKTTNNPKDFQSGVSSVGGSVFKFPTGFFKTIAFGNSWEGKVFGSESFSTASEGTAGIVFPVLPVKFN